MEFSGQYLEYDEYLELGGSLAETPFNILEFEARRKIDERTQGRLKNVANVPQEVKMCTFALISSLNSYGNSASGNNKNIASESTDGYSVSYVTGGTIQEMIHSKSVELNDIINTYLIGVVVDGQHIMYLGVK